MEAGRVRRRGTNVRVRAEVVDDLMVVPDADIARTREQPPRCRLFPAVAPMRPEAGEVDGRAEGSRELRVCVHARGRAGVVGIDHVAQPDEDVRPPGADRVQDRETLDGVATDVLPGHIAAEGEPHRGGLGLGRRGLERSAHGEPARAEANSIRVGPSRAQAVEAHLAGPVVFGPHANRSDSPVRPSGQANPQPSVAIPSRPQDRGPRRDIAHGDPAAQRRAVVAVRPRFRAARKSEARGHQR